MEQHPDADESKLNAELKGFAESILDNDLLASAVVRRSNESAPAGDDWEFQAGEPALTPIQDGKFRCGIQLGYTKYDHQFGSRSTKYIYTDFFTISPNDGQNAISAELSDVLAGINTDEAHKMIEEAWQLWLGSILKMVLRINKTPSEYSIQGGNADSMKLFADKRTGEIAYGYNIPPGDAVEIVLPPADQSFFNS